MSLRERFDAWVNHGEHTVRSLAGVRILFALYALVTLPQFRWVADYPDAWFQGPIGPWMFLGGFPSAAWLGAIEIGLAVSYVAVLIGYRTVVVSFAATILYITGSGFVFSLGKIDHEMLFVLLPAVLALAGWGRVLSVDALRAGGGAPSDRGHRTPADGGATPWAMRYLAFLIGLAYLTAALPKIEGGWLGFGSNAVRGHLLRQFHVHGRDDLLAPMLVSLDAAWFWGAMDLFTLALELGVIVAVLRWSTFRIALAVAAVFHLGVLLMMNIPFATNVVVYAAFLPWDRLVGGRRTVAVARRAVTLAARRPAAVSGFAGVGIWGTVAIAGNATPWLAPVVVWLGGVAGAAYLAVGLWRPVRLRRRKPVAVQDIGGMTGV